MYLDEEAFEAHIRLRQAQLRTDAERACQLAAAGARLWRRPLTARIADWLRAAADRLDPEPAAAGRSPW